MTEQDEIDSCEAYNKSHNEFVKNRIVNNGIPLITCPECHGSGHRYISPICDYEGIDRKCYKCNKTGYINLTGENHAGKETSTIQQA